ncbi:hypothetical protein KA005_04140 [bacterium]|nr:hypothetical protein [bacterium]
MSEQESNEFEDEIKEIIESRKTVFCPIINSMCRTDCEAFEMPEVKVVREAPPAHYYISGGMCTHFLLRKREHTKIDFAW